MIRLNLCMASAAALVVLAAVPAIAAQPLALQGGETSAPAALAAGQQYLSISKTLNCNGGFCLATVKGRKGKQTLISAINCVTLTENGAVLYGAALATEDGAALAVLPVMSRTVTDTTEVATVGGPTQIVIEAEDTVQLGVATDGAIEQAVCVATGTMTKL